MRDWDNDLRQPVAEEESAMVRLRQRAQLGAAAKGMLAGVAVSALIALAACGSAVADGAGHPASGHSRMPAAALRASAGVPLCAAARRVDRAVVSLISPMPASPLREFLPRAVTIRNAQRVRALAAALCTLAPMPAVVPCPADFGGGLRLVFAAGSRSFHPVRIQESGCRAVTGVGPVRWWPRYPQFGRLLSKTLSGTGWRPLGKQPSSVPTQ
jgi:hypothetical protein